jgi:hypothetical protein
MQFWELSLLLLPAQLDLHVLLPIAILLEDVLTTQSFANLVDVLTTNAILLPTNVKLLFLTVMMVMLVLLIASTQQLAVPTLQNVSLLMHVPSLPAVTEFVITLQRTAMILTHAPSILAIFALELALILQLCALVVLETLELATLKPLSAKSEKHVLTTANAHLMEIQLTPLSVTHLLDVPLL